MRFTLSDTFIVTGYFLATIGLGLWFGRKKVVTDDQLFLAEREATWPLIGASLFSANISSQQFVGQAGLAYTIGLAAGMFQMVGAMCFVFLAVLFVDVYLGLKLRTAPEFFERRYNASCRVFVSGINIVMILATNIMTALYAGSSVLNDLLGWQGDQSLFAGIVIMALSAGTYTMLGGLRSVLWVDLLQATILVGGGAIVFLVCVAHTGGFGAALGTYDADGASMWTLFKPWDHSFGWLPMATGAFILGIHSHCTDQDYVQRALSARNAYHAKMGALLAAVLKIVALFIIAAPGVLAARLLPGGVHPDRVYARLISEYLPSGALGVVLAGLLAAILGTVAAGLSAASSLISFDFLQRLRPGLSARERVRAGRIIMTAVLVLCVFAAPSIAGFDGLFPYLVRLWSLLAPPVFVCVLFGTFTRRANGRGAGVTLVTGVVLGALAFWALGEPSVIASFPRYCRSPLNIGFLITLVCAGTMLLFSNAGSGHVRADEVASVRAAFSSTGMSGRERAIYRSCVGSLLVVWLAVLLLFSPWGLARKRAEPSALGSTSLRR